MQDLSVRYGDRQILDRVSLTLAPRERISISGRSGRGKTTFLRVVAGFERASHGAVEIGGRQVMSGGKQLVQPWQRGVQMVFQDLGLWPTRSVRQHLLDPLRATGVERRDAEARADLLLDALALRHLGSRKPARLSGGEARRVALARALTTSPTVLLLDEPFASLDEESREQSFALLESALADSPTAVVLVTHDPAEAARLGGRNCQLLESGQLA